MLNVGWLGLAGGVPSGRFPAELIETLVSLAVRGERPMRGFHECDFCDVRSPIEKSIPSRGESVVLGMSELQVISASGQVFAAPSLIVHYIEAHDYLPPMEFIDALRAGREEELASAGIVHDLTSEVERLDGVTQAAQSTRGPLIAIDFTAESPDAVLARVHDVVRCAATMEVPKFAWASNLAPHFPQWFVDACGKGRSVDSVYQCGWENFDAQDRAEFRAEPWELRDWWMGFRPGRRGWMWWDAEVTGVGSVTVRVERTHWASQVGALRWLIRAAGGDALVTRWHPLVEHTAVRPRLH
jgi:hypothetical protein